jgi:hypothetical protein
LGKSGKAICKNCTSAKVVLLLSIVFPAKSFMLLKSFFGQVVEYYLLANQAPPAAPSPAAPSHYF